MIRAAVAAAAALLLVAPAAARVVSATDTLMIVRVDTLVAAQPDRVWATLVAPSRWWSPDQAVSGDATNLQLGERAGGCFCETLPNGGAVEHARVVRIEPGRLLRMVGALGPLQALPVSGPLTFELTPEAGRTRILIVYSLAGASTPPLPAMAPLVDTMLAEQLRRLKAAAERPPAAPEKKPPEKTPPSAR